MNNLITCIIVIALSPLNGLSAIDLDSLSVKQIVQKQFSEAKAKQTKQMELAKQEQELEELIPPTEKIEKEVVVADYSLYYRIAFLFVVGAIAGGVVVHNRKKHKKLSEKVKFKQNIQLIRNEKFIKRIDPRLKQIRTNLCLTSTQLNGSPAITSTAKKYQIGKEELALASRIKQYEQQYNYDGRVA